MNKQLDKVIMKTERLRNAYLKEINIISNPVNNSGPCSVLSEKPWMNSRDNTEQKEPRLFVGIVLG